MIQFYKTHARLLNGLFFLIIMILTIYTFLYGTNIHTLITGIVSLPYRYLGICILLSTTFVVAEGMIFHTLLHSQDRSSSLLQGIRYSLLGYFYSGITPSATGGQPVQLYYMTKDGHKITHSSVTLVTMAFLYKVVMVTIGIALLLFWKHELTIYFDSYLWAFYLGLLLNIIVLLLLLCLMVFPDQLKIICGNKIKNAKARLFIQQYSDAVDYLFHNQRMVLILLSLTFIQRVSLLLIPAVIYMGFGLNTISLLQLIFIQGAIYVAVDMLPIPGAQGITELIYLTAFNAIFPINSLSVSLVVTRGISFYFIFFVSMFVVLWNHFHSKLT